MKIFTDKKSRVILYSLDFNQNFKATCIALMAPWKTRFQQEDCKFDHYLATGYIFLMFFNIHAKLASLSPRYVLNSFLVQHLTIKQG